MQMLNILRHNASQQLINSSPHVKKICKYEKRCNIFHLFLQFKILFLLYHFWNKVFLTWQSSFMRVVGNHLGRKAGILPLKLRPYQSIDAFPRGQTARLIKDAWAMSTVISSPANRPTQTLVFTFLQEHTHAVTHKLHKTNSRNVGNCQKSSSRSTKPTSVLHNPVL